MRRFTIQIFRKVFLITGLLLFAFGSFSQASLDSVFASIQRNSNALLSNNKYWEAKRAEFSTNLSLNNPEIEFDYLFGSPVGAGNQTDFTISQLFDFPSVYGRKKELFRQQSRYTDLSRDAFRQEILLQAKLLYVELVWLNKKQHAIKVRVDQTVELVENYEKKLEKGETTILELNKAKLQLFNIRNESALNQNEIETRGTQLAELNGGIDLLVTDTAYPDLPLVEDFEKLDSLIEANDPVIEMYDQEAAILKQQLHVQKALNLPKLQAGYHSQSLLGQSYRGIHTGISIPLWENKNKLKAARFNLEHANENIKMHRIEHRSQNRQLYDLLSVRRAAMQEYKSLLNSMNIQYLLDKSLRLGEIDIVDYFEEENYYYSAYEKFLQMEWEYNQALTRLLKFEL